MPLLLLDNPNESFEHNIFFDTVCPLTCRHWFEIMYAANSTSQTHLNSSCDAVVFVEQGEFSLSFAILFGVPASIIILITVIGNFLVLCFKARVGKRQTMLLIWNLGLADFFVGVIVLPMGVTTVIFREWMFGRVLCRVWVSCDVIFCTASIVTLCIISVDRYIGVTRPLRYKLIVTKTKVVVAITSIWAFSISILLATVKWNPASCIPSNVCHVGNELKYVVHSVIFAFFIPALVTLALYWKIYDVARQRERGLMQGIMMAMETNLFDNFVGAPLRVHTGRDAMSKQQKVIKMHKKVAKTLGVVVSAFLFCWLPFFSLYLISHHCGNCIPGLALDISTWLGYCNSMLNPVIYAFTINEFRTQVKGLIRPFTRFSFCCNIEDSPVTNAQGRGYHQQTKKIPRSGRAYSMTPDGMTMVKASQKSAAKNGSTKFALPLRLPGRKTKNDETEQQAAKMVRQASAKRKPTSRLEMAINQGLMQIEEHDEDIEEMDEDQVSQEQVELDKRSPHGLLAGAQKDSNLSAVEELVWSAKLYCMLVSTKETGL